MCPIVDTTPEWVINRGGTQVPDRWRRDPGISRTILEEAQFDASGKEQPRLARLFDHHLSKIPEIDAVLINRPELPYTSAGEPVHRSRSCAAIGKTVFDVLGARLRVVPTHAGTS